MDYGLDWTDQNGRIQTANATKATKGCSLKFFPSLLRHHLLQFKGQQARKQLERAGTTLRSFGGICGQFTTVLICPVQSIVQ